jgi:hypothetical protein
MRIAYRSTFIDPNAISVLCRIACDNIQREEIVSNIKKHIDRFLDEEPIFCFKIYQK